MKGSLTFMVLDSLSQKERQSLVAAFAVAVTASLAIGYVGAGVTMSSPTGAFAGDSSSTDEIRSTVQSMMDQQVQRQQQQLAMMAQQSENLSEDDLSMEANVEEVSQSDFPSLYRVTVSITGETPSQEQPGETESIDQEQIMYVSKDGRYLFQEPTDLQELAQQQQQPQQPAPQQPSGSQ